MNEFDDIFQQINQNNQDRNQLKSAVRSANFDSIAEILLKVASKLLGRSVPALRKNRFWFTYQMRLICGCYIALFHDY